MIPSKILKQERFPWNSCSKGFIGFQINVICGVHLQKSHKRQFFNSTKDRLCLKMVVLKIFKIPRGTTKLSLPLLKFWLLELFWRWTPTLTFIWNLTKPFEQLFLGKCFCFNILQGITVFTIVTRKEIV